jgi:F-type H+-transporting ATPase subunit alpha
VRGVLEQVAEAPLSLGLEVALLAALGAGVLDKVPVAKIAAFKAQLGPWLAAHAKPALDHLEAGGELDGRRRAEIVDAARALAATLAGERSAP